MDRTLIWIALGLALLAPNESAQTQTPSESPRGSAASPRKLCPPIYPALARQARITGDVRIRLLLRKDGSVESAEIVDGHPMLKQAAMESAQKSTFECGGCNETRIPYSLVYSFEIRDGCHFGPHCERLDSDELVITQSPGRVVVSAPSLCTCDPAAALIKIRSARCLYLWRCGQREVPNE